MIYIAIGLWCLVTQIMAIIWYQDRKERFSFLTYVVFWPILLIRVLWKAFKESLRNEI